ncbi:hypothetical protein IscW_ISCW003524, partial [Ixodes scapularis]
KPPSIHPSISLQLPSVLSLRFPPLKDPGETQEATLTTTPPRPRQENKKKPTPPPPEKTKQNKEN